MFQNEVLPVGETQCEDFIGPVDEESFADFPVGGPGGLIGEQSGFDGLQICHEFSLEVFEFFRGTVAWLVNEREDLEEEGFSESDE
jgi:hypothetical protein